MEYSFLSRISLVLLFFSYPISGRAASSFIPLITGPAKQEGLGSLLKDCRKGSGIPGTLLALIPVMGLYIVSRIESGGPSALFFLVFCSVPLCGIMTGLLYRRKAGGYTGDAFGFAVEMGEVVHILIFYLLLLYGIL
jgi:cobalamin synthase